jgi:hypothetical protein
MTSELFRFERSGTEWTYTDSVSTVDYLSLLFYPEPIKRSAIEQTQELERADLAVELPAANPVAQLFQAGAPTAPVSLTIYRGDLSVGSYSGLWTGFVQSASFRGATATLSCAPAMSVLRRNAPKQRYSWGCRFQLYGSACGVDKSLYADTVVVESITGREMVVSDIAAARASGYFVGSYIEFAGGKELVVVSDSSTGTGAARQVRLELARAIPGVAVTDTGTIYRGCGRRPTDCNGFGNLPRYGGFNLLPARLEA